MRGKVLQAAFQNSNLLKFPTRVDLDLAECEVMIPGLGGYEMNVEAIRKHPKLKRSDHRNKVYTVAGLLLLDAVKSYRQAYEVYRNIGDDMGIAKCASRIAET